MEKSELLCHPYIASRTPQLEEERKKWSVSAAAWFAFSHTGKQYAIQQHFSNIKVDLSYVRVWKKCRFWINMYGVGFKSLTLALPCTLFDNQATI
jgi:hypothetical protein